MAQLDNTKIYGNLEVTGQVSNNILDQSTISGAMAFRVNDTSDTILRFCDDTAAIRTWLGVTSNATNLGVTATPTSFTITSSTGDDVSLPAVNTTNWGIMTDELYDNVIANNSKVSNVTTNISWTAGTTAGPICNSSDGSDAAIPSASGTASGAVTTGTQTFGGQKKFVTTNCQFGDGVTANTALIRMNTANAGSPQITMTDNFGDTTWAVGVDDGDNSLKIHGNASATEPIINNLATPLFEITTGGAVILSGSLTASGNINGPNVTSGSNPGHTHTGSSISGLDAGDVTTGTFATARIPTGINITGTATYATNVNTLQTTGNASYPFIFATTASAGNKRLYHDNATTCYINPSSNQIGATTFKASSYLGSHSGVILGTWGTEGAILGNNGGTAIGAGEWKGVLSSNQPSSTEVVSIGAESGLYIYSNSAANTADWATRSTTIINANTFTWNGNTVYHSGNLPTYPTVNNATLTMGTSGNGISGSDTFTSNQSSNTTFTVTSNATTSATASTIAYRDTSADLHARLFRSTYANQATITGAMAFRTNNSTDNYIRYCSSPSAIRTWLGVVNNVTTNISWTAGSTSGPICNSSDGSDATIPTATSTASGVVVTGNQTWGGSKTAVNWILSSDRRLKENIIKLEPRLLETEYHNFNFKTDDILRTGLIAQDVREKYPEYVTEDEDGNLGVSYLDLHSEEIAYLKKENASLKTRLDKLEELIKELL